MPATGQHQRPPAAAAHGRLRVVRDASVPHLRAVSGGEAAEEFDRWLEDRCQEQPVLLVVDDLQWADQGTLDVLMWVVAGLGHRRLVVLCTLRRGEVGPGHPLVRWLADVRRLPGFEQIALGPLDLEETRAAGHPSLR